MVSFCTRSMCPPVCRDLASMARAMDLMKASNRSLSSRMSSVRVMAEAAWEAREVTSPTQSSEYSLGSRVSSSWELSSCSTPRTSFSWFRSGMTSMDLDR